MKDTQTVLTPPPAEKGKAVKAALEGSKTFAFDKSYWSFDKKDPNYAGQENLFDDLGRPLLDNAFQGYNNCIFAYGQTGSGKSYSMMGYGEEEGVIPKILPSERPRLTARTLCRSSNKTSNWSSVKSDIFWSGPNVEEMASRRAKAQSLS